MLAATVSSVLLALALLLRRPIGIPAAIVVLTAPYVAGLGFEIDGIDTRAPLIAALLLAVAELAYWSLELRGTLSDEPGTYLRRVALLAGLAVGTIAAGTAVLALVEQAGDGGTVVDVAGALAAVGAIASIAVAAARRTD